MARMHTRKKGKSHSKKPLVKGSYAWVRMSEQELLALIEKLAKEGKSEAAIGQILRDQYGLPHMKAMLGKRISAVLAEKKLSKVYPSDLMDLIRKAVDLRKHLKNNPHDDHNTKSLANAESKIRRLVIYYKGAKKLPAGWKYDPEAAALLVK